MTKCHKPHTFNLRRLDMTSKTRLIEKNASSFLIVSALGNSLFSDRLEVLSSYFWFLIQCQTPLLNFLGWFQPFSIIEIATTAIGGYGIYWGIFWNQILWGESYQAFILKKLKKSIISWLLIPVDVILTVWHILEVFLWILY